MLNYLNLRLSTNSLDYQSWLQSQCFVKETQFDEHSKNNPAWEARRKYFGGYVKDNTGEEKFVYSSTSTFLIGGLFAKIRVISN